GELPKLHRVYGPEYAKRLVEPEITHWVREVIGNLPIEKLYKSDEWIVVNKPILDGVQRVLQTRSIDCETVIVQSLDMPTKVEESVEDKLVAAQKSDTKLSLIEEEQREAERRRIEARSLHEFEATTGIPMLRWRGILATETLATSSNAKIIFMTAGQD